MNTRQIREILYMLGIGRNYLGHNITVHALQHILRNRDSLLHVKADVFIPVAAQCQCDWRSVERNIRTAIHRAWTLNRPLVEKIALFPLDQEPTVTEFLDILAAYMAPNTL